MPRQTLDDIRAIPKEMLTAKDIAGFLGRSPYAITKQALKDPSKLGFRAVVIGHWPYFPKDAFILFFEGPYVMCSCMCELPCAVQGDKEGAA